MALCLLQNQLCAVPRHAAPKPALCLLLNRLCIGTKPAFSFWINISTVSEVKCDCQDLGLVARIEASILAFDTKPVLYRPVLDQIQFCSFDRRCKTCLDTKQVLYQGRFWSLTDGRGVLLPDAQAAPSPGDLESWLDPRWWHRTSSRSYRRHCVACVTNQLRFGCRFPLHGAWHSWRTNCKLFHLRWWEMSGKWIWAVAYWISSMRHSINVMEVTS